MERDLLTTRMARLQRRTRRLVTRHTLLTHTAPGRQLLRQFDVTLDEGVRQQAGIFTTPDVGYGNETTSVPMETVPYRHDVADSPRAGMPVPPTHQTVAGEQHEGLQEAGENPLHPTPQPPPSAATSDEPKAAGAQRARPDTYPPPVPRFGLTRIDKQPHSMEEQSVESGGGEAPPDEPARAAHPVGGKPSSVSPETAAPDEVADKTDATEPDSQGTPQHDEPDLTPQGWMERLRRYVRSRTEPAASSQQPVPADDVAPRAHPARPASPVDETPTPLSASTRHFLRPLVGFDPTSVRVFRGSQAQRLSASYNADALAVGDAIVLGSGQAEERPETIGLLAHELTHIARRHMPRFVPPVAISRNTPPANAGFAVSAPLSGNEHAEEHLAQTVEARVTRAARAVASPGLAGSLPRTTPDAAPEPTQHSPESSTVQAASKVGDGAPPDRGPWGSLPPPWEPLPDWLTASANLEPAQTLQPASSAPPTTGAFTDAPSVQTAPIGRTLETDIAVPPPQPAPEPEAPEPTPDLERLAQQVYAILKRRMAAERRREEV